MLPRSHFNKTFLSLDKFKYTQNSDKCEIKNDKTDLILKYLKIMKYVHVHPKELS